MAREGGAPLSQLFRCDPPRGVEHPRLATVGIDESGGSWVGAVTDGTHEILGLTASDGIASRLCLLHAVLKRDTHQRRHRWGDRRREGSRRLHGAWHAEQALGGEGIVRLEGKPDIPASEDDPLVQEWGGWGNRDHDAAPLRDRDVLASP